MSPARGRPKPENPKSKSVIFRLTDTDAQMLEFAANKLKAKKSEIIRRGIVAMYEEAKKEE